MRVGLVVPHIFIDKDILPRVIFSPGALALDLASGLQQLGTEVTLFTPGSAETSVRNVTADMSLFEQELAGRGYDYLELLKKHPLTFVSLARQVQAEIIAKAFAMANNDELDIVHIYTNEEDIALPFVQFCKKPVVLTHHDPFRLLIKYKSVFPKHKQLNWISMSHAQRAEMPPDTNWVANIYHGLDEDRFTPNYEPKGDYIAYLGRIIEAKGVHLAIAAAKKAGAKLKIAGKHYAGHGKDDYWREKIEPQLGPNIEYVGFLKTDAERQEFLGNARALVVPSTFNEPFGMVAIEALACATPIIALDSGALPEIITNRDIGVLVNGSNDNQIEISNALADAIGAVQYTDRTACRLHFEKNFTLPRMVQEQFNCYRKLIS